MPSSQKRLPKGGMSPRPLSCGWAVLRFSVEILEHESCSGSYGNKTESQLSRIQVILYSFFRAVLRGLQDLSSPSRD